MESIFLFLLIGISIYFAGYIVRNKSGSIRCLLFVSAGFFSSTALALTEKIILIQGLTLPLFTVSIAGCLAGLLLFYAEKGQFFTRPGIKYLATPLFGIILAGIYYGLTRMYLYAAHSQLNPAEFNRELFILYFLWGFIVVFGYAIPARWFKQKSDLRA